MISLFGNFDKNRKYIEDRFDTKIRVNDEDLEISGDELGVKFSKSLLDQLLGEIKKGKILDFQNIKYHADMLERENKDVIKSLLDDVIITRADGKPIKAKTLGQKSYIDKIRNNDIVFGIGPAGTGKTYLGFFLSCRQGELLLLVPFQLDFDRTQSPRYQKAHRRGVLDMDQPYLVNLLAKSLDFLLPQQLDE